MRHHGCAEVEPHRVQEKISILDQQWAIEAQLVSEGLHVAWMPASKEHDLGRISRD